MEMHKITSDNWTFVHFSLNSNKAFVTIGGNLNDKSQDFELIYFVTVTNSDFEEIFQKTFATLEQAILFANANYSHWEYNDALNSNNSSECTSCVAH